METMGLLMSGFHTLMEPRILFFCFIGVVLGTLVGVLPGLGPVAAISLLLPTTFKMTPVESIIMLAGIFYGAMYGGSTTSILVNVPGEAASVITCLDGYQMARKGRAGPALGISAFASFIAGTLGVVGLMLIAPPLADFALKFGPPENLALMLLGLTILPYLASGSMIKGLMMATLGLLASTIGTDLIAGLPRFTMNIFILEDGLGLVPVVMGMFGIGEVLINVEQTLKTRNVFKTDLKSLLPTLKDWKDSKWPIIRGSILGFFLGILPGGGGALASFVSYGVEKRCSKYPEKFGTGMIEGVAGPEAANNSGATGSFIPLLTLGLPSNAVTAILMGALMIHGITPNPLLIQRHPDVFWGLVASMYVGNVMLLILNLPLIGLWVKILKIPYVILFPLIMLICLIGAFTINNSLPELYIMIIFGILGYILRKFEFEGAPFILAMVLGPMFENALRQSLIMSGGSFGIFVSRPIAGVLLLVTLIVIILPFFGKKKAWKEVEEI